MKKRVSKYTVTLLNCFSLAKDGNDDMFVAAWWKNKPPNICNARNRLQALWWSSSSHQVRQIKKESSGETQGNPVCTKFGKKSASQIGTRSGSLKGSLIIYSLVSGDRERKTRQVEKELSPGISDSFSSWSALHECICLLRTFIGSSSKFQTCCTYI